MAKTKTALNAEWFTVDRAGLAQVMERESRARLVLELLQNSWDTGAHDVEVTLVKVAGTKNKYDLQVTDDDPNGFADLRHSFTLFAPSVKKGDPTLRGRFNLGEKLVLAVCDSASVASTTGTVFFGPEGRTETAERTERGTVFSAVINMTADEYREVGTLLNSLIPPDDVRTTYNSVAIPRRTSLMTFRAPLATEAANGDGVLRATTRITSITLYKPHEGEKPHLYEMGIPVCRVDFRWHVDIGQRVPLNMERNNVTPAYLRALRAVVLENTRNLLDDDDLTSGWVREALKKASAETIGVVLRKTYGDNIVSHDPRDPEASNIAVASGAYVLHSRDLPKEAWGTAREAGLVTSAGVKYKSNAQMETSLDGVSSVPLTPNQQRIVSYIQEVGSALLPVGVKVEVFNLPDEIGLAWFGVSFGVGKFGLNLAHLGKRWFDHPDPQAIDALVIHELAHFYESNHLTKGFYDACCQLGARLRDVETRLDLSQFGRKVA